MKLPKKVFDLPSDYTPEQVLAEINANISKANPNIGTTKSTYLKGGPRAFKYAVIYQILNANTTEHHHFALSLGAYHKYKDGWEIQGERSLVLDDQTKDEIGLLCEFITNFKKDIPVTNTKYGIVEEHHYQQFKNALDSSSNINSILEDNDSYNKLLSTGGTALLGDLLEFVLDKEEPDQVISRLKELNVNSLNKINSIAGISQIQQFLELWPLNSENNNEEFWQKTLSKFSWVISQVFSYPYILFQEKAYLGGKSINNKGGNIIDFLYQNQLTENTVLIEIKTPCAKLLGNSYRQTYSISDELSGAVSQTLKYKAKLQRNYTNLASDFDQKFEVFNPKALLIIGNFSEEIDNNLKNEAIELFRLNSKEVEILTFDELFAKVQILLSLLEGTLEI